VGHDLGQPGLHKRRSCAVAGGSHERADRLGCGGAGCRRAIGEWVVAQTSTSAGRDAKGEGSTTAKRRRQDRSFEIARAIEAAEPFLGGLTTSVGEDGELRGGGDVGAIEDP